MRLYSLSIKQLWQSAGTIALLSALAIVSTSCIPQSTSEIARPAANIATRSETETKVIRIAVIPWQSPEEQQKKLQPLTDYLEKTTGRKFDFQITKDYKTSVDLLVDGKVDIAYLGGATYVQARERNSQVEPIVAPIDKTTGRPWYTSVIVANADKGIKTIKDLKGKKFAFVSPSSTSGGVVPKVGLQDQGINPQQDFSSVKYSGSHDKAEADLAAGNVDAIADDMPSFLRSQKSGSLKAGKYKIIWESDPIPTGPIVVSTKLSPELITSLKKALINSPAGIADVSGTESAGYTLVNDTDYDPVRQTKARLAQKPGATQ